MLTAALVALLGVRAWPVQDVLAGWGLTSLLTWLGFEWIITRRVFPLGVLGASAALGPAIAFAWFLGAPSPPVAATVSALTPWLLAALCVRGVVVRVRERLWPAPSLDPQLAPFL